MKTITLEIIKKNRVYFKCKTTNGFEVKLKVTEKSKDLTPGIHELLVNDISIRTKYGTDIIYEMEAVTADKGITTLKHRYNIDLIEACQKLGGRWDSEEKAWVFSKIVEDKVEELEELYNCDEVTVEITALDDINKWQRPINFLGYVLAKAKDRDSGAKLGDDVALIAGKIASGGSIKNWTTSCTKGTVFRLNVPRNLLFNYLATQKNLEFAIKMIK